VCFREREREREREVTNCYPIISLQDVKKSKILEKSLSSQVS
jgi:hypothetical protein